MNGHADMPAQARGAGTPDRPGGRSYDPPPGDLLPYEALRARPRKGRGALSNHAGRYEALDRMEVDDGWGRGSELVGERATERDNDDLPPLATSVSLDASRSVIARNKSPDIGFDRSINPYRGCEHGCIYCFARPTHAWLGLSPGLDFETRLFAKPDAAGLLRRELAAPKYRARAIAMGTNTDPYQPIERRLQITRSILEVLAEHDHPVSIVTKSATVCRDIDILAPMAEKGLVSVGISVTTLDAALARVMEPRAAAPLRRLETISTLVRAGIPVTVMVAPVVPGLTDHELEAILIRARNAGAAHAGYILLRLPLELKALFGEWLDTHLPDRKRRVLKRIREMRGGDLYRAGFGERMRGSGPGADLLATRFKLSCRQLGYATEKPALDAGRFHRAASGDSGKQQNRQFELF